MPELRGRSPKAELTLSSLLARWGGNLGNPSSLLLMLSSGAVRHFATSIPDFSPQILRTVV
jgi:hypothetical protein